MTREYLRTTLFLLLFSATGFCADREVNVDGVRVHVSESGSGPTVVFESGMGEDVSTWNDVRPRIAEFAHTFAYERPGLGSSQPTTKPRTVDQMATDLHSALQAAGIAPPYILVGHSLGGAIIQVFAHRYANEIAGLVLVDPEDGRLLQLLHARMSAADWEARRKALDQAMPNMPPAIRAELHAADDSGESVAHSLPLPHVPVVVLTGTQKNPEFPGNPLEQDLKLEMHNALVADTPGAKHYLAPNSRHYIQNDAPDLVVDAVRQVVSSARPLEHAP